MSNPDDRRAGGPAPLRFRDALLDRHSFVPVLLLALGALLAFPFADSFRGANIISLPFIATLTLLALDRSWVTPRTMRAAIVVLCVVTVGTLTSFTIRVFTRADDRYILIVDMTLYAVLYAMVFPAVVRRAFQHRRVNLNTLAAGISAYLIIGLWFTAIYRGLSAVASLGGTEFFRDVASPRAADFVYFSFVTLTTLGYGDLVPISDVGRSMVIFEAVMGQVFLVTAVARIVSLLGSDTRTGQAAPMHDFGSSGAGDEPD